MIRTLLYGLGARPADYERFAGITADAGPLYAYNCAVNLFLSTIARKAHDTTLSP